MLRLQQTISRSTLLVQVSFNFNPSTTGKNYVGLLNTGAAMKTVTVTGDTLDADENALTAVTTIDASAQQVECFSIPLVQQ